MRFAICSSTEAAVSSIVIPLAVQADGMLGRLVTSTGSAAIAELDGATLLGERAMLADWVIPGAVSAGGGTRFFAAVGDNIALNLARGDDRALLPALLETDALDPSNDQALAACIRTCDAAALVARGRSLGLALAMEHEIPAPVATLGVKLADGRCTGARTRPAPRVLDLSALWAGPLAAHLLWLAGADVVKVESRSRPDVMRQGDQAFHSLLNGGKSSVSLDFTEADERQVLLALIAASDIVIEAARPRALLQLGIDAAQIVATTPGLVWVTITAHGAQGDAADWVGFGDDCAVAAGLSSALRAATGQAGFVGDAIADPLTGIAAASLAWNSWKTGQGGRYGVALAQVTAHCLARAQAYDPAAWCCELAGWAAAAGRPFPAVRRRVAGRR